MNITSLNTLGAIASLGVTSVALHSCTTKTTQSKTRQPNIIYILADDLGYGDVRALNPTSTIPTPYIDSMVASGITFTDAHSNAAVSTPTRYGTLTGRYCFRSRLKSSVLVGLDSALIEPERMTVASLLRDSGYRTACIGKWHLGLNWASNDPSKPLFTGDKWNVEDSRNVNYAAQTSGGPNDCGFNYSYIIPSSLGMPPYVYLENGMVTAPVTHRTNGWHSDEARGTRFKAGDIADDFDPFDCLQTLTTKSIEFINSSANQEQPFFLYFPLTAPHTPWLPAEKFRNQSGAGVYGDFVCMVDDVVGQIYRALRESGQADNTLVIFTSDNGGACWPEDIVATSGHNSNTPFAGMKSDLWEGGHRIPFVATWANVIKPGTISSEVVCSTDLLATCAELVGQELPENAGEDSYSIIKALKGEPHPTPLREATIHHSDKGYFALRQGDWVLVDCKGSGGWTLTEEQAKAMPSLQLYNVKQDTLQRVNMASEKPELVAQMKALLDKYVRSGNSLNIE